MEEALRWPSIWRSWRAADQGEYERYLAAARAHLDSWTAAAAWAEGQALTEQAALARALAMTGPTSAGPVAAPPSGRLSERQREVAALVAQGLSNREIAARLTITERTAENHVQHVMDKLGFRSRSQIASWVTAHQAAGAREDAAQRIR